MWLFNSSIGRKVVMSVTGMALILFLTFHMSMNVVALFSAEGYNMICEMLGANWYAVVATMGLAALAVIHIIYAFILTMKNRAARGSERYADFWAKMMLVDLVGSGDLAHSTDGAYWIQYVFSNTGHVVFYLLWLCALWFHLAHGFWSMLQTMGLSGKVWFTRWKVIGIAYVTVLCAGFASVVVWFYIQSLI